MIVFPGDPRPQVKDINTIEEHGYNQKFLSFASHTGTHIDAPNHILAGGKTLDTYPLEKFYGKAAVVEVKTPTINEDNIVQKIDLIEQVDFVLFRSGWDKFWNEPEYFLGYPYFTDAAASLLTSYNIKGIGIDTISPDEINSLSVHRLLLSADILIIENLTGLSRLPDNTIFDFWAIPLKIKNADGAPVRCWAEI